MKYRTKRKEEEKDMAKKKKKQNYRQLFSRQTLWEMLTYSALMSDSLNWCRTGHPDGSGR